MGALAPLAMGAVPAAAVAEQVGSNGGGPLRGLDGAMHEASPLGQQRVEKAKQVTSNAAHKYTMTQEKNSKDRKRS